MQKWIGTYAGYGKDLLNYFMEVLLHYDAKEIRLLDPMFGSGSLLVECKKRGISFVGYDVNIAQVVQGRSRLCSSAGVSKSVIKSIVKGIDVNEASKSLVSETWYHPSVIDLLNSFYQRLHESFGEFDSNYWSIVEGAFLLALRPNSCFGTSSNPTWLKQGGVIPGTCIKAEFLDSLDFIFDWHDSEYKGNEYITDYDIQQKDIRLLSEHDQFDLCITSPPYCNRLDYKRMFAPEVFYYETHILKDSQQSNFVGSNIVRGFDDDLYQPTEFENDFLSKVRQKQCPRDKDYYYKYYKNYFNDLDVIINNSIRSIKHGGILLMAVQNSHYKDIPIKLDEIILSKIAGHHFAFPTKTKSRHFFGNIRTANAKQLESVIRIEKQ